MGPQWFASQLTQHVQCKLGPRAQLIVPEYKKVLTLYSDIEKRLTYWRTWKRGVFTLGPSEYRTPELCTASTKCKPNLSYTSLCLIWSFRVNLSQVHEKFMKKIQMKWMFLKWVFWKSDEKLPIFASLTSASKITFLCEKISNIRHSISTHYQTP